MNHDRQRRRLLTAAAMAAWVPATARGQETRAVTDGAGRKVTLPAKIERIYAAGAPASVLAFAVAPDKLMGWTSPFRDGERPFVAPRYADLPAYGRLT